MAERPIPPKFRKLADHLMVSLWPRVKWPSRIVMLLEDDASEMKGAQADILHQYGSEDARIRMATQPLFIDFNDDAASIAHELAHLAVDIIHGPVKDPHGPEWRAEMKRIGLPVDPDAKRERVEMGGLFWVELHKFLASELAPELTSVAGANAALAAGRPSSVVEGPGVTPAIRAAAASANQSFSGGGAVAPSGGGFWGSITSAFNRQTTSAPQSSGGGINIFGPEEPLIHGPRGSSSGHNLIFADCSISMSRTRINGKTLFEIQRSAIGEIVPHLQGRHTIFGYAVNSWRVPSPDDLFCDLDGQEDSYRGIISGTSFMEVFMNAARFKRDEPGMEATPIHIHLFSDGEPQNELMEWIMAERGKITGDISTYYLGSRDNTKAIQTMKVLARDNGKFYHIESEDQLISAVRQEIGVDMPFTVPTNFTPRPLRDWEPERAAAVDYGAQLIKNQTHLVEISTSLSQVEHDLGEVKQQVGFLGFNQDVTRQVLHHANQALDVVEGQRAVDREARAISADQNDAWMEGAGAEMSRQSAHYFGDRLLRAGQLATDAASRQPRRMTLTVLDPNTVSRATALMAGRGVQGLPSPQATGAPALAAPSTPVEANIWDTSAANISGRRQLIPVRRG